MEEGKVVHPEQFQSRKVGNRKEFEMPETTVSNEHFLQIGTVCNAEGAINKRIRIGKGITLNVQRM